MHPDSTSKLLAMWEEGELEWDDLPESTRMALEDSEDEQNAVYDDDEEDDGGSMDELFTVDVEKSLDMELLHKANEEHRFTLGPWYIPNQYDAHGEWTDAEELQKALWDYVQTGDRGIRLQHNKDLVAGEWLEAMSFPVPVTIGMTKDATTKQVTYPAGTVFLGVQWKPWAWEMVKAGKITGFSIGGAAARLDMSMPVEVGKGVSRKGFSSPSDPVLFSQVKKETNGVGVWEEYVARGGTARWMSQAEAKLLKASFASRSEAARYAANMRWRNLKARTAELAQSLGINESGTPVRGPMPMPKTKQGRAMRQAMKSLDGHIDFDKAYQAWVDAEGNEEQDVPLLKTGEKVPYHFLRLHMTPERAQLHDEIVEFEMAGKVRRPSSDKPVFVFMGGGPASGKTTMLKSGDITVPTRGADGKLKEGADSAHAIEISADEYKAFIPEYEALRRGRGGEAMRMKAAGIAHEESSMIAKAIQRRAMDSGVDIVLDGLGDSDRGSLIGKVRRAREAGYQVRGLYATIPTEVAVERASARGKPEGVQTTVSEGFTITGEGRYVSPLIVRAAHAKVSAVLPSVIDEGVFDEVTVVDTKSRPAKIIYRYDSEAKGDAKGTVVDSAGWQAFLDKGEGFDEGRSLIGL
jgi:hypothetical protein